MDTLTAQVTYFGRKESYRVTARNSHSANQRLENLPGAVSKGEFGSTLRWIFEPEVQASFEWREAGSIHRRRTSRFAYRVERAQSRLELAALSRSVMAAFHGPVYIDDQTGMVLRLTLEAEVPEGFSIRKSGLEIDYGWTKISGHEYLAPVYAETRMTEDVRAPEEPRPAVPVSIPRPVSCIPCDVQVTKPGPDAVTRYRNRIDFRNYRKFTTASSRLTRR